MTYASEVLADAPRGFWKLNETAGTTLADSSGNARDMTVQGTGQTFNVSGPAATGNNGTQWPSSTTNYGITAAGVTDGAAAPVSLEAWVFLGANPTNTLALVGNGSTPTGTTQKEIALQILSTGQAQFLLFNVSARVIVTPAALTLGVWHHLVGTAGSAAGDVMKLYLDGALVATGTSLSAGLGGRQMMVHGGYGHTSGGPLSLADVAWYPTVLSAARIAAHYNPPGTPAPGPELTKYVSAVPAGWTSSERAAGPPDASYATTSSTASLAVLVPGMGLPGDAIVDRVFVGVRRMSTAIAQTLSLQLGAGDTALYNTPNLPAANTPLNHEVELNPAAFTRLQLNTNRTVTLTRVGAGNASVDAVWMRVAYHLSTAAAVTKRWDGSGWVPAAAKRWGHATIPRLVNALDGSFEQGVLLAGPGNDPPGWLGGAVGITLALDDTRGSVGTKSLRAIQDGASTLITCARSGLPGYPEGTPITVGFDYLLPPADPSTLIQVQLRDDVQGVIFESATITNTPVKDNAWHRLVYLTSVPAGFKLHRVYFRITGGAAVAKVANFDALCLYPVHNDGAYMDGDTADTGAYRYDWTGIPGQSPSIRYPLPEAWQPAKARRWDGTTWTGAA